MKTIKPLRLGLLVKPFENEGKSRLVVSIMAFFPFDGSMPLGEASMWTALAEELEQGMPLDECMPKHQGELIVVGKAFPPGSEAQQVCQVRVQFGSIDKSLNVVGDRYWKGGAWTAPVPYRGMPISWRNAFGGEGFDRNPVGKGARQVTDEASGDKVHPLPNVEHPDRMVKKPKDKPEPAGFGGYEMSWPQRMKHAGTYDKVWLEKRFPGFAEDFHWSFFNVAPPDQQIDGFFSPGQSFACENLHDLKPKQQGRLANVTARCFVTFKDDDKRELNEVPTRIDTVVLLPHIERGIAIYRGVVDIKEDDAHDVAHLVAAFETPGQPKPVSHYATVLDKRLDKEMGALHTLNDSDLMPPFEQGASYADQAEIETLLKIEGLLQKNLRRRAELELEKAKEQVQEALLAQGLDPADYPITTEMPPEPTQPQLDELPAIVEDAKRQADEAREDAERKRAEAEAQGREACEANGLDYDELVANAREGQGGPPTFTADGEIERLESMLELSKNAGMPLPQVEARLAEPDLREQLEQVERQLSEAYRKFAHHMPEARRVEGADAHNLKTQIATACDIGESFAGRDLTGADMSGLSLADADFRDALLERVNLRGANLVRADLSGAVLARADLSGAKLTGAKLTGANLGKANLANAELTGAKLQRAVLFEADLSGAVLDDADIEQAELLMGTFGGASLANVDAKGVMFVQSDLTGIKLEGARLDEAMFVETTLSGADFSGASLASASFVTAKGDGASFAGAQADNVRVVHESSFAGADFRGASMKLANFRGTNLERADFSGAELETADFSECNLRGAKFYRASARSSLWIRTDLSGADLTCLDAVMAIMQKANIEGADFKGANLFRVDFAKIRGNKATKFDDANMNQIRFVWQEAHDQG